MLALRSLLSVSCSRRRLRAFLAGVVVGSGLICAELSAQAGEVEGYRLDVKGSPALKFRMTCTLVDGEPARETRSKVSRENTTPAAYRLLAGAVSCQVRKLDARGRLIVVLSQNRHRIAAAGTTAPFNHVKVRSHGPWGKARAVRGKTGLLKDRKPSPIDPRTPFPNGTIVPPLNGTTVPPL